MAKNGNKANSDCKNTQRNVKIQERIKASELIPHIGPLRIVIFGTCRFYITADNISSRVAWKFRGGVKAQKHVGSAGVAINAKREDKEGLSSLNAK